VEAMERKEAMTSRSLGVSIRLLILRHGIYVSLGLLLLVALFLTPELYAPQTLFLNLRQASQLGLVSIGQTLVLLIGGLDLSVGGVITLTSIMLAQLAGQRDDLLLPALGLAFAVCAVIGLGNGLLIVKRNVPPFVATLGMLVLIQGAQLAYTRGVPSGEVPQNLSIINQSVGPLPIAFLIWMAVNLLFAGVLYFTPFGRRLYAVGSNREAARLSGINVDRIMIVVYVLCSLLAALAGVVLSSYVGYVDRYVGRGFDLDSIAAAIVGGTAFAGGRGTLLGTVAGVLLVQFLASMMLQLGLDIQLQLAVKGLVIIGAVALYSVAGRK
jgi:ribose/xylose/arabinose/galactoside ABC-type transport system permease subunit